MYVHVRMVGCRRDGGFYSGALRGRSGLLARGKGVERLPELLGLYI